MSRDDGFAIADVDTGLMSDPKVVALARRLKDPVRTAATVTLFMSAVLESWAAGDLVSVDDAAPAWWLEDVDQARADLVAAGLVDAEGKPTGRAWEHWFRPAFDRREKRRESGRQGGLASGQNRGAAEASPKQSPSDAQATLNPTVPSVPSVPSAPTGSVKAERATAQLQRGRSSDGATTNGAGPAGPTTCPKCGDLVVEKLATGERDENVLVLSKPFLGELGHGVCPTLATRPTPAASMNGRPTSDDVDVTDPSWIRS